MPEHSTLTDPDQHEPKGTSTASAGDVYFANGAGSGTWSVPGGNTFGDMDFTGNSTATVISSSGVDVLLTGATLVTPGVLWTQGVTDTLVFSNTSNNELITVDRDGIYEVSCALALQAGTGTRVWRVGVAENGTVSASHFKARRTTTSNDVGSIGFSEIFDLSAGDTVQLAIQNETDTQNPTITDAVMTIVLFKES